ncbi:MAG: 5'-deoxynucleotidase [Clostridia bacterium]|nr:5'-deoxynucleotidase [Clostridia bacterium]
MSNHFFAYLSRMKNIYRWGLMRNSKPENLSEHSLEVAIIAHALCLINNKRLGGNLNAEHTATAALFHDTSEIITGDLPTPIKYYNPEINKAYKQIESVAEEKLLSMLPEYLSEEYLPLYKTDEQTKKIIKAADKISAYIKCIEETKAGNSEFSKALSSTEKAIHAMNIEEAEIFLKEFIPSYKLPLDKQN